MGSFEEKSGRQDLNLRLPAPKAGALAKLSYVPLMLLGLCPGGRQVGFPSGGLLMPFTGVLTSPTAEKEVRKRGLEPPRGLYPTRPSTWRVCQFRHLRSPLDGVSAASQTSIAGR